MRPAPRDRFGAAPVNALRWLVALCALSALVAGCPSSEGTGTYGVIPNQGPETFRDAGGHEEDILGARGDDAHGGDVVADAGPLEEDATRSEDAAAATDEGPDATEDAATPEDAEPAVDPDEGYDPDWVDHPNRVVENCLELVPAVCNKIGDCEVPFADQIAGFCPGLADGGSGFIIQGCEQLVDLVPDGPGVGLLANLALDQLEGCIERYECTTENLTGLVQQLISAGQGAGGGGGNIQDALAQALPQVLGIILNECGINLPFGGFP